MIASSERKGLQTFSIKVDVFGVLIRSVNFSFHNVFRAQMRIGNSRDQVICQFSLYQYTVIESDIFGKWQTLPVFYSL